MQLSPPLRLLLTFFLAQAWILFPSKHPTCVIGRVPDSHRVAEFSGDRPRFCASLYSMGKGGVKGLDCGPKMGLTRKEALMKLLAHVETNIGWMMIEDKEDMKEIRKREEVGISRDGGGNGGGSRS
jgi:hypothetical protein